MAPPKRALPPAEVDRLDLIRRRTFARLAPIISARSEPPLDRIARLGAVPPVDAELASAIGDALDERFTWREIATALGWPTDRPALDRLRRRYRAQQH
jgi:hypothetical protein